MCTEELCDSRSSRGKIMSFVQGKMKDLLGEVDQDLADFVQEHLKERKGPKELVGGLEPVRSSRILQSQSSKRAPKLTSTS